MRERNSASSGMSRRTAMRNIGLGLGAAWCWPVAAKALAAEMVPRIERIGLQLYTVRSALARDLEGTLAAIAQAGITELEFAGYYGKTDRWWRDTLQRYQLAAPATHEGLPATDDGWTAIFDRALAIGHRFVIVPFAGAEFRGTRANWQRLAARLNQGALQAKAVGLQFAYHNHDFEFQPVEGTTGFDILSTETDPALVKLELDLYWAVKGGQDPLALFSRWPGRIVCCHVKDAGPLPERRMLDVGAGTIDFAAILRHGRAAGLQHWFIEHDAPTDPLASIRASAAAMKRF